MSADPKLSPLHDRHVALGAKFAEFGGWSMPMEYAGAGVLAEHTAVRTGVGVFDVSHLGKATISGHGAVTFANRCLAGDLGKITPGRAQYTLLCNEAGGVVDDMIAYLKSPDELFLIPNAANTSGVVGVLADAAPDDLEVIDQHEDFAVIAVQGTHSDETLRASGLPVGHDYMSFVSAELDGLEVTVCRTGYTGERGYELVCPAASAARVWDAIVAAGEPYGIQACGLGARDTLRTEMGYPLHGQDLSPQISPVQGRSSWAVGWDKEEFIGREALLAQRADKPARSLRGLKATGRGIPRPGMTVLSAGGAEIGTVTSGTYSPTCRTGIALALLDRGIANDTVVSIDVRGRSSEFVVTKPPFVTPGVKES